MAGNGGVHRQIENGVVTNPKILRFNAAEKWEKAHEPLNYGIDCLRACGLGPGMAFANEILKRDPEFGVIGVVPCAKGGTPWRRGYSPYDSLIRRAKMEEILGHYFGIMGRPMVKQRIHQVCITKTWTTSFKTCVVTCTLLPSPFSTYIYISL